MSCLATSETGVGGQLRGAISSPVTRFFAPGTRRTGYVGYRWRWAERLERRSAGGEHGWRRRWHVQRRLVQAGKLCYGGTQFLQLGTSRCNHFVYCVANAFQRVGGIPCRTFFSQTADCWAIFLFVFAVQNLIPFIQITHLFNGDRSLVFYVKHSLFIGYCVREGLNRHARASGCVKIWASQFD